MMKHALVRLGIKAIVALSVGLCAWASGEAQRLVWISACSLDSSPAISGDGSTVVFTTPERQAVSWRESTGINILFSGVARAVSRDGSTVVGYTFPGSGESRACVWRNGQLELLDTFGGRFGEAYDVSADGSTVVGRASDNAERLLAFRWTLSDGLFSLGEGWARAISGDGRVIFFRDGRRWHREGGFVGNIGFLPTDASFDGSVAVGFSGAVGYYWTASSGATQIPNTLGGAGCYPYGVSADGRLVVGTAMNDRARDRAFRWRPGEGMEDLNFVYGRLLGQGDELLAATGISESGRYIVGYGRHRGVSLWAFLLDTCAHGADVFEDGCVDDTDLLLVLFRFGQSGSRAGRADVNCDGVVDDADLLQVLFNFGSGC